MTTFEIPQVLAEHPLFEGLDELQMAAVCRHAEERHFAKDRPILREGGAAQHFFVIRVGRVSLEVSRPGESAATLQTLGPGEVLGWSWLVPPYTWHFDARALDEVQTIAFNAVGLRALMDSDHALGYRLARRFLTLTTARLQAARVQLLDLYAHQRP